MAFEKISNFFGMNDEDDIQNDYDESQEYENNKIVSMSASNKLAKISKIIISEPRDYSDAKEISQQLLSNKAVVVNFSRVDEDQSKRIVDFIAGTVFAINGEMKSIGDQIFLCTPPKFEIDGDIIK